MKVNAAFIFLAPEVDNKVDRTVVQTPVVQLTVVAAKDYDEAELVAKELAEQGVTAIELCGGFGNEGVAQISKCVCQRKSEPLDHQILSHFDYKKVNHSDHEFLSHLVQ